MQSIFSKGMKHLILVIARLCVHGLFSQSSPADVCRWIKTKKYQRLRFLCRKNYCNKWRSFIERTKLVQCYPQN